MHVNVGLGMMAGRKDLDEILRLQYLSYQSEAALFGNMDIPTLKQTIDAVISEDGAIIGSIRAWEADGTVYIGKLMVHLKDKDELIDAIKKSITEQLMDEMEDAVRSASNSEIAIVGMGKRYVSFFRGNPDYFKFLFGRQNITAHLKIDEKTDCCGIEQKEALIMNNYKIYGNPTVDIVIEMGLGACIAEWEALATKLGYNHGVLVYERAGINHSKKSDKERTPTNIARELKMLLDTVSHEEKVVVIGHSQGGLYAAEFCGLYPEMIKRLILLDPLSKTDVRFKKELTPKELKQSGADKSKNFDILRIMARLGLKSLIKKIMYQAPPFYYAQFTEEQRMDILNSFVNITNLDTCKEEYRLSHDESVLNKMVSKEDYPDIPIVLITHSSEEAIKENMEFGRNERSFAIKVEELWQDIMKDYMDYSNNVTWIQAEKSTHYIHLIEPEIIVSACT